MAKVEWLEEEQAANMLGYQVNSLRIFTYNEKRKKLPIRVRKPSRKKILYNAFDIQKYIESK